MFDHERLIAYQKTRRVNQQIQRFLIQSKKVPICLKDQLHRAANSILLNIAEGTGRIGKKDRKRFYVIARASAYECAAIMDVLFDLDIIGKHFCIDIKNSLEETSRLLSGLIRELND